MIKAAEKKQIIAVLGGKYSRKIIPFLTKKKIFNSHGNPFSPKSVQKLINATEGYENLEAELAIAQLVDRTKAEKAKIAKAKSKLLK